VGPVNPVVYRVVVVVVPIIAQQQISELAMKTVGRVPADRCGLRFQQPVYHPQLPQQPLPRDVDQVQ
jgi:hypothetical protein